MAQFREIRAKSFVKSHGMTIKVPPYGSDQLPDDELKNVKR
jgi:hypothetical protein